jgi:hypothetical protein
LLINAAKLRPLAAALATLGYGVVPGAEHYQFVKQGTEGGGAVKIDVLTGPRSRFDGTSVRTDTRRARPHPSVGIHAHPVDEVPTLEEGLRVLPVSGVLGSGTPWQGEVFLPNPFSFLMMKLFAFKDRRQDRDKEFGRYHALDLYSILATMSEEEWEQALRLRERFANEPYVVAAGHLVREHFSALDRLGMVRLQESRYYRSGMQLGEFAAALAEIFPVGAC